MWRPVLSLFKETFQQWNYHKAPKMGAALAYYAVLSLAPLVMLALSLMSLLVKRADARTEIVAQFSSLVGRQGGEIVDAILAGASSTQASVWSAIVGFIVLLIGASGAFGELQDSLNQIWDVKTGGRTWMAMIKDRVLSFTMVFAIGFLLLISLVLSAGIAAAAKFLRGYIPANGGVWEAANLVASVLVITILFALIFRILPDTYIAWRDVWVGAALTSVLFTAGKFLIGLYLGKAAVASSYGAAGSLIIVLLWTYYSSQILFFGAEFTRVFAHRFGTRQGTAASDRIPQHPDSPAGIPA